MSDNSNLFVCISNEEGKSKSITMKEPLFWEKSLVNLSKGSAALCLSPEKSIGNGVPCFPHRSTMTEATRPLVKRKMVIISLFALFALLFLGTLLYFFCPFTAPQHLPNADGIKAEKNMAAAAAALSVVPENLTLATLLAAEQEEPSLGAMRNCLKTAAEEFSKEPSIVKRNAMMTLRCDGRKWEFLSGKGGNLIEVAGTNETASYIFVHEAHPEVHLARLGIHPLPLSVSSIVGVLQDVIAHNGSEELQSCLRTALQQLPWEPEAVQNDAKMVVSCDGKRLTFISGKEQNEIDVFTEESNGPIQYRVKATGGAWWSRFFKRGKI